MSAVNVTLLPYSGLLAGEEIMLMGTTIPAPVDSAITNVTLVSSTSLASRQPVTAGIGRLTVNCTVFHFVHDVINRLLE